MNFNQVIKFAGYKIFSRHKKGHGIHSPFVFNLITNVFSDKNTLPFYRQIEARRKTLMQSDKIIFQKDFGALNRKKKPQKKISAITRKSVKNKKYAQLLNKLVVYYDLKNIIELGTSFGITTSYLYANNPGAKITTIEGCENISAIAKETFDTLKIDKIELVTGNFDNVLTRILEKYDKLDFVFFDGNHKKEPTLKYFDDCIKKINNNSIFVFDDIYWSKEMEAAWKTIIKDKRTVITIDIFSLGLVFFNSNHQKQHFVIRY